ncbi:hypothetical protein [Pseudotabrizicola algicola]|uniref:MFS transporter n=1 Tax=Pseudotabrizicola algicola TaxID=2709381 RepID=A0A6B3RKD9_9RHOB|nr:hypothetical protein [Pseudotabrizicola algicola]NEX46494.1 hypothetical protein [Pseudotabrizicola algicola]
MPRLLSFMLRQFCNGAVMGLAFAQLLLWANVGNLPALLASDPHGGALTGFYFAQGALLFGTLGMSVALMNLSESDE